MRRELLAPDHARRLGRDRGVHGHDVGLREHLVEGVLGLGVVGVEGDHAGAEPLEPPLQGPAHRTQAHQPDRLTVDLPCPEPLVGDGAVPIGLAGAHVGVGLKQVTVDGEDEGHRHLGDGVGVASGGVDHRYAAPPCTRGCPRCSDRRGWTRRPAAEVPPPGRGPCRPPRPGRGRPPCGPAPPACRRRTCAAVTGRSTGRRRRRRWCGASPGPIRCNGAVTRARGRSDGATVTSWPTVTPVSCSRPCEVTVGIDIGTTSVKAVVVDASGLILDRVRVPHPIVVPGPNRFEHDAEPCVARRAPRGRSPGSPPTGRGPSPCPPWCPH